MIRLIAQEKAASRMMLEKLGKVVSQMFHRFAYEDYFGADTGAKLSLILAAEDHILGLENGRKRYVNDGDVSVSGFCHCHTP